MFSLEDKKKIPEDNRRIIWLRMKHNQSSPINITHSRYSTASQRSSGIRHPALPVQMEEFGSVERPGVTEGGAVRVHSSLQPKINLREGGNECEGGGGERKRREGEAARKSAGGNARESDGERGECLRLQRIKNCAISRRASPAHIKLAGGRESSTENASADGLRCVLAFLGKTLKQFGCLSHHLLSLWFHNAAAPTFYSVRFKCMTGWRCWRNALCGRRSFTERRRTTQLLM